MGQVVDIIISWSLIYINNLATSLAIKGKVMNWRQRKTVRFLYWLAYRLSQTRNYDDQDTRAHNVHKG